MDRGASLRHTLRASVGFVSGASTIHNGVKSELTFNAITGRHDYKVL